MTALEVTTRHSVRVPVSLSVSVHNYPARELRLEFDAPAIHEALDVVDALRGELKRLAGLPATRGSVDPIFDADYGRGAPMDGRIVPVSSR